MGSGFIVCCKSCGECDDFTLGVGMLYYSIDNVLPLIKGRARKAISDINNILFIDSIDCDHKVYACPLCNTLNARFYARIEYGDNQIYETKFRCGKCRSDFVEMTHPIDYYNCKKCGQQSLEHSGEMMLWD